MAEVILRGYQRRLVDDVQGAFREHRRVLAWLPTGGGKTELAVHLAQQEAARGGTTLFVVDRRTLAGQAAGRFAKYGLLVGVLRGESTLVRGYEPVVVASVQTLAARSTHPEVERVLERTTLCVIDEAHVRFEHHEAVERAAADARILGLSATPLRDGLGKHFDVLVRGPSYAELIKQGHLVQPRYRVPDDGSLRGALEGVEVASTGDFVTGALSALMRGKTLIGDVPSTWIRHAADRPTICFGVDIAHSKALCDALRSEGVAAEHIDQRTPEDERAAMFKRFREGRTRVLCSVAVLALGFDEPSASCAILARPTLSTALYVQQAGRVLRPAPGKADTLILDHAGNALRHGRVEDFEPPELSEIDRHSDRKRRSDERDCFPCPECREVLSPGTAVCPHCGHELRRRTVATHAPGELTDGTSRVPAGPSREEVRQLYREVRWIAEERGRRPGWAFHTVRELTGVVAPWSWRDDPVCPPSTTTLRLVQSRQIRAAKARRRAR